VIIKKHKIKTRYYVNDQWVFLFLNNYIYTVGSLVKNT